MGLVYVIVGLLLLLQMLTRLAWIDVLLIVSPLAAACWVLPQTQGWAQSWNEQFTGAVFTQFVQVVALKLGGLLLAAVLRPEPDLSWLSFLMGAATLWLTWRIPGLMRAGAGGISPTCWRKRWCCASLCEVGRQLMGLVAKIALALGVDGLARWVVGALVTLICVSLLVALIVVQMVATVPTGGQFRWPNANPCGTTSRCHNPSGGANSASIG
jgi:hypothetical protein